MNVRQRTRTVARLQDVYDAVDRLAETLTPRPGQWPIENAVEPEDVAALTDILDALAIKLTMAGGLPATAKDERGFGEESQGPGRRARRWSARGLIGQQGSRTTPAKP